MMMVPGRNRRFLQRQRPSRGRIPPRKQQWLAWLAFAAWGLVALLAARGLPASLGFATTPPPPQPPKKLKAPKATKSSKSSNVQRKKNEKKLAALERGKEFLDAILNNPFETLPNYEEEGEPEGEMRLWRDIPDLEAPQGRTKSIVLRSIVEPFWQSCIDRVEGLDPDDRYRVCAIGTPGIGKTFTTPLLLRMLLLNNSTVVYIRRSPERKSWYYEFIPTSAGTLPYTVNVYPEASKDPFDFPSLEEPSAYYVVDPGESQVSCSPMSTFAARVIIISSPNDRHWGGGEFRKYRGGQRGKFHYYPLWNLNEVLCGLGYFYPNVTLSPQQVAERYRQVGGVPRHLFETESDYNDTLQLQARAVKAVNSEQAMDIVSGEIDTDGLLDSKSPKSAVIGIELADNDHGAFTERKAVPISAVAAEQVFLKHITTLWNDMVDNERPLVFESYLRTVLTREGYEIDVSKLSEQGERTFEQSEKPSKIGNYIGIQIVPWGSIVKAAIESPTANILFYSANPRYPLIDFACKDNAGNILAFQATTSLTHSANEKEIKKLENEVGDRGLTLYYLHPARRGSDDKFATNPVRPKTGFCRIYHLAILKPGEEMLSQTETEVPPAVDLC